jgi:hypothetical protein
MTDDLDTRLRTQLSELAASVTVDVSDAIDRRLRTRPFVAAAVGLVILILAVGVAWSRLDGTKGRITNPATTTPRATTTSVPNRPTRSQVSVPLGLPNTQVAYGSGRVWVGGAGVEVFDPRTLRRVGRVPIALPVVEIATTDDAVWVLSGRDYDLDPAKNPPYRLTRIDPTTLRATFATNLPFAVGYRSLENLRMVAVPGTTWVVLGATVLRFDARTNAVTTIDLAGSVAGSIAADSTGFWTVSNGFNGKRRELGPVIHVDARTNAVTSVRGMPIGFYWSVATIDGNVWIVASAGSPAGLRLFRIDEATEHITSSPTSAITLVTGDGQLWAQFLDPSPRNLGGDHVGQIDLSTGRTIRRVKIAIGQEPGSSGDGYTAPPFAVADGSIWSAYNGLQRTNL